MSGSGLWTLNKEGLFKLVGIMIEDRSDIGLMVAIKLNHHLAVMNFIDKRDHSSGEQIFEILPENHKLFFGQFRSP